MADRNARWDENAPGKYYVDESCICTEYCVAAAPRNFAMSDEGHAYVLKQPETQEEEEQCQEAVRGCPPGAIGGLINRTLAFLTGGRWRVFFRDRQPGLDELIERPPELIGASFDCVCLFSGGLDSFVGAIDLLEAGENPLFVSHYWDASTSSQKPCAALLGTVFGTVYGDTEPSHVRARVGFPDDLVRDSEPEKITRGRSFPFFALAVLAASALEGECQIYVPENGLISLNVPLDPLRLGAWSTRTTHPFYMARWQEFIDNLSVRSRLVNPYRFKTKGEMLSHCANAGFLEAAHSDHDLLLICHKDSVEEAAAWSLRILCALPHSASCCQVCVWKRSNPVFDFRSCGATS